MRKISILYIFVFFLFAAPCYCGLPGIIEYYPQNQKDQLLYNGREWRNLYTYVKGDQFLYSKDYLPATVSINSNTFTDVNVNYDIYHDELIIHSKSGPLIQLNKELVDSFSLIFQGKTHRFMNMHNDSVSGISGYVNSLYTGKTALIVKYKKEIDLLAVDEKYDLFFETYRIYLLVDAVAHQISGKSDLLKVMDKDKTLIKAYMKKNSIKVSRKMPESFIPVIRYYESISQ
jgi:hypothetical protein